VIITHFHFDHVGGAVSRNEYGELLPTFPKATYWTNQAHYDWAFTPNPREKASFLKENFVPLRDNNVLKFVDTIENICLFEGIHLGFCYGHTEALITPYLQFQDKTLIYCADLLASPQHIGLPYVMSYDIRPLETMKEKERVLRRAAEEQHILFFEHDKSVECATVKFNEKGNVVLEKTMPLKDVFK
jgi:glyoxylase-like metal-dependent hydrolase (beta-lactamase superfamily II)